MSAEPHFDTVIVGGGSAGCVLAARLSEEPEHRVALVEAGPDFGPANQGRWPAMLNGAAFVDTPYDWRYQTAVTGRQLWYKAGKVVGGSSAINGTGISWGLRRDYDEWEALGNPGWGFDGLLPFFHRVERLENDDTPVHGRDGCLPVTRVPLPASPYLQDVIRSFEAAGVPGARDVTGPDALVGVGTVTRNVRGNVRFHAAAAYLDQARHRPNLTVLADTLADRIEWEHGRAHGLRVLRNGHPMTIEADRVVLASGAIGSPSVLQRSGIGPAALLRRVLGGGTPLHDLPGVGRNLHDHCATFLDFRAAEGVYARLLGPGEQSAAIASRVGVLARLKSRPEIEAFDLDVAASHWAQLPESRAEELMRFIIFLVHLTAEGYVEIASLDPEIPPAIETGFGNDADVDALARGIEWLRARAATAILQNWYDAEGAPGESVTGPALRRWVREHLQLYYHATGTCKLGPASDRRAVVDAAGRVHGFDNLYVADASLMPTIPRGMIILTVYAIAEKIAAGLSGA